MGQTVAAREAIAYALRTGCGAAAAAARYRVGVRTVQRGLVAAGVNRPRGRPVKEAP
jgi:hypothetical protein